jgi:hypothetical protein
MTGLTSFVIETISLTICFLALRLLWEEAPYYAAGPIAGICSIPIAMLIDTVYRHLAGAHAAAAEPAPHHAPLTDALRSEEKRRVLDHVMAFVEALANVPLMAQAEASTDPSARPPGAAPSEQKFDEVTAQLHFLETELFLTLDNPRPLWHILGSMYDRVVDNRTEPIRGIDAVQVLIECRRDLGLPPILYNSVFTRYTHAEILDYWYSHWLDKDQRRPEPPRARGSGRRK